MQRASRVSLRATGPRGQQMRPGGPDPGAFQHCPQVCRRPQHAAVRDIGQRPQGEPERGLHFHVPGLSSEGPEVTAVQRRAEGGRESEAQP